MLGTPLARPREPWETIGKSKEASDAAQWERIQTGRVSEHFWAKSDYVRRLLFCQNMGGGIAPLPPLY